MLPKGLGGMGDMAKMVKQAMALKDNMEEIKESLAHETVEASSGGGMVTVVVNGKMEVLSMKIAPEIDVSGDAEILETFILAAVNLGLRKAQDLLKNKMQDITGVLIFPV